MDTQQHLFDLPEGIHYLNCGYMAPLLKTVQQAGIAGIQRKVNPAEILPANFFAGVVPVREKFAQLVNGTAGQVALIPSASYGLATAIQNLPLTGTHAITVGDEFPSGYLALEKWCGQTGKALAVVKAPGQATHRGRDWNEAIVAAINNDTTAIVLSSIHWMDGTLFDLPKIGERCRQTGTVFIVDGTQSVGALPIDVTGFGIDALVCAGYKWLMGPYSTGLAYYSPRYNDGRPLEETWMNRTNAEDFSGLTQYSDDYQPGAARYHVGEYSNFILTPMLDAALDQLLIWHPSTVQDYCRQLTKPLLAFLQQHGFATEQEEWRAAHLFGIALPPHIQVAALAAALRQRKVYVSVRGNFVRVSPHVYNTPADIAALQEVLAAFA